MLAVRALDAALRLVALAFGAQRDSSAAGGERGFHLARIFFAARELDLELLHALLALEHAASAHRRRD